MSVYVGMDVHRKRSQVAIVDAAGEQQRSRNLPNDLVKLLPILGGLPPGTPVAFEARLRPAGPLLSYPVPAGGPAEAVGEGQYWARSRSCMGLQHGRPG